MQNKNKRRLWASWGPNWEHSFNYIPCMYIYIYIYILYLVNLLLSMVCNTYIYIYIALNYIQFICILYIYIIHVYIYIRVGRNWTRNVIIASEARVLKVSLPASWGKNWEHHHSTIVLRGLRKALNWAPIMPQDVRLSSSYTPDRCCFFLLLTDLNCQAII